MLRRTARTQFAAAVTALTLAVPVTAVLAPGAEAAPVPAPATCAPWDAGRSPVDTDGDGLAERVFPIPAARGSVARIGGVVEIRETGRSTDQVVRRPDSDGTPGSGDRFGAAVATAFVDEQDPTQAGCTDLVVGAPGVSGTGRAYVVFGSPLGSGAGRSTVTIHPEGLSANDQFGAAVAVLGDRTLRIGAPGTDLAGAPDAGAIYDVTFAGYGEDTHVDTITRITRDTNGVPGAVGAGDRFGAVIAPNGAVGIPSDDLGSKADAGSVWSGRFGDGLISQGTPGVPGIVESGDRFGAAIDDRHGMLVVGSYGEDVGRKRHDAGSVTLIALRPTATATSPVRSAYTITQDTTGVPGKAETGDRFGSAVAWTIDGDCAYLWAGSPGEDLGKRRDAGNATRIELVSKYSWLPSTGCNVAVPAGKSYGVWARTTSQDSPGIAGSPESGDRFGASFGVGTTTAADKTFDTVTFGAPGEDLRELTDVGAWTGASTPDGATSGEQVGTVPMLF